MVQKSRELNRSTESNHGYFQTLIPQDYQLPERIPEVLEDMAKQAALLHELADQLEGSTQERGGHMLTVRNLALQLESMAQNPESIQLRLEEYRDNLSALGTWILQTVEQPLQINTSWFPAQMRICLRPVLPCGKR